MPAFSKRHSSGHTIEVEGDLVCPLIYGLVDPEQPEHVRYVGMASKPLRPFAHAKQDLSIEPKTYVAKWVRRLLADGKIYRIVILETIPGAISRSDLGFHEKLWIASCRLTGHLLTNATPGGDGGATTTGRKASPEECARIGAFWKGRKRSEEQKRKQSIAMTGRKIPPDVVERRAAKQRVIKRSAEFVALCRDRKHTDETKRKMSANCSMRRPEVAEKAAASNRGRKWSEEERAKQMATRSSASYKDKMRKSMTGRVISTSWRANMSTAAKSRSAKRKEADSNAILF